MIPSISVILPVFNAASHVEAAVQSILMQSFEDFELILLDDGSTDASKIIVRELAKKDTRIRLIQRANKGLVATLNEGLRLARAPLIARMDADDIALPHRLALQYERMKADLGLVVLGGAIRQMDAKGFVGRVVTYPERSKVDTALLWGSPVAHPAVMLRTDVVHRVGGYPTLFPHAEDYALWLQMRMHGMVDNLPQVILHYRVHGGSISHVHALEQRTSTLRAQALWLAKVQPLSAWMDEPSNINFLEALPLSPEMRIDILARMLSLSPHLLGDGAADAETAYWFHVVSRSARTATRNQGLAWFHLRAARCCKKKFLHGAVHLCGALAASPKAVVAMLFKWLSGNLSRLFYKKLESSS